MEENREVKYNSFFLDIQSIGNEKGVHLTYANKRVYLSLLEYVRYYYPLSQITGNGIYFPCTIYRLKKFCKVAHQTVITSLQKLQECGLVIVWKEEKMMILTNNTLLRTYY